MTLSDLISFIGIILAIIAFIDAKERLFIVNKFSKIDIVLIVLTFFLINILLFYDWWKGEFPFLIAIEYSNSPSPNTWVYFIVILFIFWFFYKITYSNFPKNNQNRVLNFYSFLLQREDFAFLFGIIEKYEKKQLLKRNNDSKHIDCLIKSIFLNKDFLFKTSNYNYQLFNKILLNNDNIESALVNNYIESHLKNSNSFIYNSNILDLEKEEFYLLANKTKNLDGLIIYIIRNNFVPIDKLFNFILIFSLNKIKVNELYKIVLQEVIVKKDNNALELFFIEYLGHIRINNYNISASFESVSLILLESIKIILNNSNFTNILRVYLDIILFMIDTNPDEIKRILLVIFKSYRNESSKLLLKEIYETYYHHYPDDSKKLGIIFNEIYS
jgi:hypothetical protein